MGQILHFLLPTKRIPNPFVEATRFKDDKDMNDKMDIYFHGLSLFEELFGYRSKTIIPTNYLWNTDYNNELYKSGIIGVQGVKRLYNPINANQGQKLRYLGLDLNSKIVNLVRNNRLELSLTEDKKIELNECLRRISHAFLLNKPAVISMHRINFSGEIFEENRNENLNYLFELFSQIKKKWPEVEFLSSDQLALKIINT